MHCSRDSMSSSLRTHGRWLVLLILSLSLAAGCGKDPTKPNPPPAQAEFHVNAATGLDTNDGSSTKPFKTITHAIAVADTGRGASLVRANVFRGSAYGLYLVWTASVVAQDNDFIEPNLPIHIHEIPGNTVVRRNLIVGNGLLGIMVAGGTPLIEGNSFEKPGENSFGGI
jgi:hypothetical protein